MDSKEIARGGFLTFCEEIFESPTGDRFVRWMVEHPGAVAAVPVEDGPDGPVVVLVRQWRPALRDLLLEIPAGKLDVPGEDARRRHGPGAGRGDPAAARAAWSS